MTARDYPVTLGFGATSWPYSVNAPHEGEDLGCPVGTDVVVAGTLIARSGATGNVTGPHVHYARYKNGKIPGGIFDVSQNRTYFNPHGAFDVSGTVTFASANGTAGNEVTILGDDGWYYRFLHNSSILSRIGDKVGNMPDPNQINQLTFFCWGPGAATPPDITKLNSQPSLQAAVNIILADARTQRWYDKVLQMYNTPSNVVAYSGPPLFVEKKG